jgi:hypothetical protein
MIAEIEGDTAQFGPGTTSTSLFGGRTFGEEDIALPEPKQNLSEEATQSSGPAQPMAPPLQSQVASLATPVAPEQQGPSTASRKAPKLQVPKEVQDLIQKLRMDREDGQILDMLLGIVNLEE